MVAALDRCIACGTSAWAPTFSGAVRRCSACGLSATVAAPARPYDEAYYSTSAYRAYFARGPQWRLEARLRLRWLLAAASPGRLLEVGCAGGFFLEAARGAGIEASGVELSPFAAEYARDRVGVPVTVGAFQQLEVTELYDAICAFHVLEHASDPVGFLAKAHAALPSGGVLALEVPNVDSATARRAGAEWPHLLPAYHRWHFTPGSLSRLVAGAGFSVERCDTVFDRHYLAPADRLRRFALAGLAVTLLATRSPRAVHRCLGDHLRLLARRLP